MPDATSARQDGRIPAQIETILAAFVERIAPEEPCLAAANRVAVMRDVKHFVIAEVAAMPTVLRAPYVGVLVAFDLAALFSHGRRFVRLDAERASHYVERWAESRLRPLRDFVKVVRGYTLLAFYDHPLVRKVLTATPDSDGPNRGEVG